MDPRGWVLVLELELYLLLLNIELNDPRILECRFCEVDVEACGKFEFVGCLEADEKKCLLEVAAVGDVVSEEWEVMFA